MAKKKQKFAEPPEGWTYTPKGDMCLSCTKLLDNCSGLGFANMKAIMETYEGHKVVKCTSYVHGSNDWSEVQTFKNSTPSFIGSHYS